jgi:hypothetical protein
MTLEWARMKYSYEEFIKASMGTVIEKKQD